MLCSFCSAQEPVRIEISSLDLRICPYCLATFLPATQFGALRREVQDSTKGAWIRKLKTVTKENLASNCLEHKQPLVSGTIPGYSFEGLVPTCCDLQHIPPPLMIKILEMGIGAPNVPTRSMGGIAGSRHSKSNGLSRFLGGFVFHFWEKRQKNVEDGIDRLQYSFKFKEVLGEWVEG
ncbi:MAG: hypothetical protein LBC75_06315 [Fibromonadaceae bacterium]|jgi:hypothetical protein|nr:hypothetical protein [Fibromonadaceae bacterium]